MAQEFTLVQSPRLRTAKNVFPGGLQGAWTPTVTFSSPGDLSVNYTTRAGWYTRIGSLVVCFFHVECTPTFSTSSNPFQVTNLPFTAHAYTSAAAILSGGDISMFTVNTTENYTVLRPVVYLDTNLFHVRAWGDNGLGREIEPGDITSGNALSLFGSVLYIAKEES